jgi:hypothetical protein
MNKGQSALRGSMRVSFDDTLYNPPEVIENQEIEQEEDNIIEVYASLNDHPGWVLIKKDFKNTINSYRSGKPLQQAIPTKSLEEIGRLTITTNAIADELEKIILTVETAVAQVEEKIKDGRRSQQGN